MEYYYLINVILFIFLIINLFFLFYFYQSNKDKDNLEKDYSVLMHILDTIVNNYKTQIYTVKYNNLLHSHDLDENSQTNSKKLFDASANDLLSNSCSDILNNFVSKQVLTKLSKYYTTDSIISIIIKILKE
jgi:predicted MPP superfamily phosphohydrolase